MNLVVVDFEWNQAMSSRSSVYNYLPIHLVGEIIEIGAVRLDSDLRPSDEFTIDVRPAYFRKMHHQVKKITGFDKDRLENGVPFPEAFEAFRKWCGDGVTFITWGCDDQGVFEQNIIIHDLDWDWVSDWINLQMIYNVQTGGDKNQKSLASAMEHFSIEQTRIAHDALGDAYNTALVSTCLDLKKGILDYDEAPKILASRMPNAKREPAPGQSGPEALSMDLFEGFSSKAEALASDNLSHIACPVCGGETEAMKWVNQGDQRYINILNCEKDGDFLVRARFHKTDDVTWSVNRIIYKGDAESRDSYKNKAAQARRRGRGHTNRRQRPAK